MQGGEPETWLCADEQVSCCASSSLSFPICNWNCLLASRKLWWRTDEMKSIPGWPGSWPMGARAPDPKGGIRLSRPQILSKL